MPNFINIRQYNDYDKGILAIEVDDGPAGNYTHWMPLFMRIAHKYTQWYPYGNRTVVGCSALNTAAIGGSSRMSVSQLQALHRYGWEMMSHGTNHVGVGSHELNQASNAGDTVLAVSKAGWGTEGTGRTYKISDGISSEDFTLSQVVRYGISSDDGEFHSASPLQNSYGVGAVVRMTDATAELILKNCRDTVDGWVGIGECAHHVYTYHHQDEQSEVWAAEYFKSARGKPSTPLDVDGEVNLYSIPSKQISSSTNVNDIYTLLDAIALSDDILVLYGHGETDDAMMTLLENIIVYALEHGIRIMTHDKALKAKGLIT